MARNSAIGRPAFFHSYSPTWPSPSSSSLANHSGSFACAGPAGRRGPGAPAVTRLRRRTRRALGGCRLRHLDRNLAGRPPSPTPTSGSPGSRPGTRSGRSTRHRCRPTSRSLPAEEFRHLVRTRVPRRRSGRTCGTSWRPARPGRRAARSPAKAGRPGGSPGRRGPPARATAAGRPGAARGRWPPPGPGGHVEPANLAKDLGLPVGLRVAVLLAQLAQDVLIHLQRGLVRLLDLLEQGPELVGRRLGRRSWATAGRAGDEGAPGPRPRRGETGSASEGSKGCARAGPNSSQY